MSEDYATATAPRHPIQGLLDDVDTFHGNVTGQDGMVYQVPFDPDFTAHLKDMLMSAYATGVTRNG